MGNVDIGKIDIEKSFLGSLIVEEGKDLYWISEDNFYSINNRLIFKAIQELTQDNSPIDLVSIKDKLWEDFDTIYLVSIINDQYSSSSISYYANLLKEETKRVELIKIAEEMIFLAQNKDKINWEIFTYANKLMGLNTLSTNTYNIENQIEDLSTYLDERRWKELFGYSWGDNFNFLNKYTKGIQKGRTYRLGAPSNAGKSQMMYWVINNLLNQNARVAFFTLENDKSFTMSNILANHQWVNSHLIEDWTQTPNIDYIRSLQWKFFLIDDCYELSEIFSRILEIKPDVVILDYIGLVQIKKVKEDDKYTEYSKQVQEFVKQSRVGWIDLSNLPKNQEDEESIKIAWGFYWSSFLKNNADVGIHLYYHKPFYEFKKLWMSDDDTTRNFQVLWMYISKNRIGTAKVEQIYKVNFNKWGRFEEATAENIQTWLTWF